jgi:hypothetical protein
VSRTVVQVTPLPPQIQQIVPPLPVEGNLSSALGLVGFNFAPGSVVFFGGLPLTTVFIDAYNLFIPGFLAQLTSDVKALLRQQHRHVPRHLRIGDGVVPLLVVSPGFGVTLLLVPIIEAVAPGDLGTAAERAAAIASEQQTGHEADTSPQFQHTLKQLRRLGI